MTLQREISLKSDTEESLPYLGMSAMKVDSNAKIMEVEVLESLTIHHMS